MTASTGYRPAAAWSAIGRHWWWGLAFGVITVAAGICALVWPGITLLAAAVIFGVQLIIGGVYRLVAAFSSQDVSGGTRVLLALLGVLSLIIGLYAVRHVLLTIVALALLLGIFWIASGVIEVFTALSYPGAGGRGWRVFMGIVSIIAGIVLLAIPAISLLVLVFLISAWLLLFGVMEISLALRLRSAHGPAAGTPRPTEPRDPGPELPAAPAGRAGAAPEGPAPRPCQLGAAPGPARPAGVAGREQPPAASRPGAGPVRADAGVTVRLLARVRRDHG